MTETNSLRLDSLRRGQIVYVRLYGAIDETFDVTEILAAGDGRDLIINIKGITRISSFGVREWVNGIAKLKESKNRIVLADCSPVMVKQFNMISNFAESCDVISIQAPYYCKACGWDTEVSHGVGAQGVAVPPEPVRCQRCKGAMELDEDPSFYFRFAQPNRFRPLDPHITEFIESYLHAAKERPDAVGSTAPAARERSEAKRRPANIWRTAITLAIVAVAAASLAGIAALLLTRSNGVPADALQRYHTLLASRDLAGAEKLVQDLQAQGTIPATLATSMGEEISAKRQSLREESLAEARRHLAQREYEPAVTKLTAAEELGASGLDIDFTMAECLRRLGRAQEADARYVRFLTALKDDKSDRRLDDALYWRGDYLVKAGRPEEARPLLDRLLADVPRSDYRRSATRLLESLP